MLAVALTMVALGIGLLAWAVFHGAGEPEGVARSLSLINYRPSAAVVARAELGAKERLLLPLLDRFQTFATRLSPRGTGERLTLLLDRAGNPGSWSVERVMGGKGVGLLVGVGGALLVTGLRPAAIPYALVLGTFGFFLPDLLVYNASLKRQEELRRGLADALDMLTICVEAGQGFDAAILQVARAVRGPIAGEFARVLSEIQIGSTRAAAFASLADRTTATEVRTFVSALVQADRLGLPIAGVLREQAAQLRLVRRQRAEEAAQKVTVKILFPLLLCIFPALFIVIIGPGAIRMIGVFGNM